MKVPLSKSSAGVRLLAAHPMTLAASPPHLAGYDVYGPVRDHGSCAPTRARRCRYGQYFALLSNPAGMSSRAMPESQAQDAGLGVSGSFGISWVPGLSTSTSASSRRVGCRLLRHDSGAKPFCFQPCARSLERPPPLGPDGIRRGGGADPS